MKAPKFLLAALAAAAFTAVPAFSSSSNARATSPVQASAPDNSSLEARVQKKLGNGHFKNVTVQVNNGAVVLGGTVDLYQYKAEADDKAHHVSGVTAVDNEIQVESKPVTDAKLGQELAKKLAYDREGWPDAAFNSITLSVANGVVTLGGNAAVPWAKASAISLARNMQGVKDVIDNVTVDPESPVDDQTRVAVYRAVYGQAALNKYLIDPAKPIRITVVNGNVTLTGEVYDQMDKNIAGIQANTVPGVFKVTNNLAVANQGNERRSFAAWPIESAGEHAAERPADAGNDQVGALNIRAPLCADRRGARRQWVAAVACDCSGDRLHGGGAVRRHGFQSAGGCGDRRAQSAHCRARIAGWAAGARIRALVHCRELHGVSVGRVAAESADVRTVAGRVGAGPGLFLYQAVYARVASGAGTGAGHCPGGGVDCGPRLVVRAHTCSHGGGYVLGRRIRRSLCLPGLRI